MHSLIIVCKPCERDKYAAAFSSERCLMLVIVLASKSASAEVDDNNLDYFESIIVNILSSAELISLWYSRKNRRFPPSVEAAYSLAIGDLNLSKYSFKNRSYVFLNLVDNF